jgi:hypothetical protein
LLAAVASVFWADGAEAARRGAKLDPVGAWTCVVYGHPAFGDERVLLRFAADGTAHIAREAWDEASTWSRLDEWVVDGAALAFRDPRTGRRFQADLRRETLGGGWRTLTLAGGWWCRELAGDSGHVPSLEASERDKIMPPLVPELTATPAYPVKAIRAAKQGRAVSCFFVDASGRVVQPELIELSDEIFREPILAALERSRYRGWDDARVLRPGCRSYIFKLDAMNLPEVTP